MSGYVSLFAVFTFVPMICAVIFPLRAVVVIVRINFRNINGSLFVTADGAFLML